MSDHPVVTPPLRSRRSGCTAPRTARPVLRLGILDGVPARKCSARLANLGGRALEYRREDVRAWQVIGECRDRECEQHPPAHREDI